MSGLIVWGTHRPETAPDTVASQMAQSLCHLPYHHVQISPVSAHLAVGTHTLAETLPGRSTATSHDGQVSVWAIGAVYGGSAIDRGRPFVETAAVALDAYLAEDVSGLTTLNGEYL